MAERAILKTRRNILMTNNINGGKIFPHIMEVNMVSDDIKIIHEILWLLIQIKA